MNKELAIFCCGLMLLGAGCNLKEIPERVAILQKLQATNAPLGAVEAAIGSFKIYTRKDSEWQQFRDSCMRESSPWYHQLVQKIDNAHAFGASTTPSMQTWIFLDEQNRLIDFEVGTQ